MERMVAASDRQTSTTSDAPVGNGADRGERILSGLDEAQRRAASAGDGPVVVFAGAGSGKTRVITHRIAWLIEQGIRPWEILAVTFTNKAAQEMRQRVDALTPYGSRITVATFHSACARWLREFAPELGYTSDFTIYDDDDQTAAVKIVLKELQVRLDEETPASEYKAAINRAKTLGLLPSDERLANDMDGRMPPSGAKVYARYQEYLAACNAMDFGDLLLNVLLLLRRNAAVRTILQQRFRHILVDEYQDTNRVQLELVARLAEGHGNLFVVGDDDQSIYSWRGAQPANILEFDKVYPAALRVVLEQNYRCSGTIVNAAGAMIRNNVRRAEKRIFTQNENGALIDFRLEVDNELEAWWVASCIRSEMDAYPFQDVAIFYRTNSQSRLLEDALRRENIPHRIFGTVRFYDRMEVKDLMAYFRLTINPSDDVSLKRILNVPARGIGDKAEETITQEAVRRGLGMYQTIEAMAAEGYPRIGSKLKDVVALLQGLRQDLIDAPIEDALTLVLERVGYKAYIEKKFPDQASDKLENIHELGAALADFASSYPDATIAEWLQQVTLASSESDGGPGVSMMTLHTAKGLEFRRVFIVGLEENLLPHRNSLEDPDILEEERRLCYVGMTRARERLSMTAAYRRRTYNTWAANRPSRFLTEIPAEYFATATAVENAMARNATGIEAAWSGGIRYDYDDTSAPRPPTELACGAAVQHPTYGAGVVESIVEELGVVKVVVRFREFGLRKVMGRHLN